MDNQDSFKERSNRKLTELRSQVEYLNMKMHLGANEARDEFEVQKQQLTTWINKADERLGKLQDEGKVKASELRTQLDQLRVQAALGKAETEDALRNQQKDLRNKLEAVKTETSRLYEKAETTTKDIADELDTQADNFHTRFDMLSVQLNLGKAEAKDLWENQKKDLSRKLSEISSKAESFKSDTSEKWDGFSREMSESWKHFRKAFRSD